MVFHKPWSGRRFLGIVKRLNEDQLQTVFNDGLHYRWVPVLSENVYANKAPSP